MLHQRCVVLLALGAPEAGWDIIIFLKVQGIKQQVIRDGRDVAYREFDVHIDIVGRVDESLVHKALIVEVSGIDVHLHVVEDHELVGAVVGSAGGMAFSHKGLFDIEVPRSIGRNPSYLQLVGLIRSGGGRCLQIRLVLVPAAIAIQPIGRAVVAHDLDPEGDRYRMGAGCLLSG